MKTELDLYDITKLQEAKKLIYSVYEYNYFPGRALTKKLNTILDKLEDIINQYEKQ